MLLQESCTAPSGEALKGNTGQGHPVNAENLLGLEIHPCVTGMGWGTRCGRGKIQASSLSLDVVERELSSCRRSGVVIRYKEVLVFGVGNFSGSSRQCGASRTVSGLGCFSLEDAQFIPSNHPSVA